MRQKPCWSDSLGLEILYGWVLAFIVAICLLLVSECTPQPAHAGQLSLDVAGGVSLFGITATDGDYRQNLPHSYDATSLAYRVGLCWHFNKLWSTCGAWINLGTMKQDAQFVDDRDYNPKTGQVTTVYGAPVPNKMTDAYKGGELTLTRTFTLTESISWHLKAGGAWLEHKLSVTRYDTGAFHQTYGQFPTVVAGGGLSYKWLYTEAVYYHGLGGSNGFMGQDQGWPLSKEMLVTWFGVKIPLS